MNRKPRFTKQRKLILDELKKVKTHPTAQELYDSIRKVLPNISLGTVYRNLELLCQQGMAKRVEFPEAQRRYDGDVSRHYHIQCVGCGKVGDIYMNETRAIREDELIRFLGIKTNYDVHGQKIDFFGLCPECKSRKNQEKL